ncbi:hypothetical protein CN373_11750 [Bacillus cereus]|uniref:Uncharacterized protein n=1 Tax=Bacillus cereus TaxID=1396 RepID=A0AA44TCX5_BACCE|nr:hypothetical protein CN373_11750 [Bacillus cereus]PFN06897.1 hypothetical protein COJ55_12890 [Bacillus cereus]PFO83733.1 hypothetical protein COJ77_07535 [Bacillus cereus]PFR92447.1 hypothetical protein COK38_22485 [Bacillus cereus]
MDSLYDYINRKRDKRYSRKTACPVQLNVGLFVDGLKDVTIKNRKKSNFIWEKKEGFDRKDRKF